MSRRVPALPCTLLIGLLIGLLSVAGSAPVSASSMERLKTRPTPPERSVVGAAEALALEPSLGPARIEGATRVWRHAVSRKGASFVKLHLVDLHLATGDTLRIRDERGRTVEELRRRGPKERGSFWTLSAFGESAELELEFSSSYDDRPPFTIDRVIFGDESVLAPLPDPSQAPESLCEPADFEDVICYESDAEKWANVQASVGVMSIGGDPDVALFCSGANVSPDSLILTNQHCIETQVTCDNSEFVFRHYRTGCGDGSPPIDTWQSFRCDEVLVQSPFVSCEQGLDDLDFTLASVVGEPAATFGFVQLDPEPIVSGEDVYIIQHPDGRPHEITHGGGTDVLVDGTVLRYFDTLDTEDGSSGSPIFREGDDRLVGLHHCGGCETEFGNRGMLISDIYPAIEDFVCTAGVTLKSGGIRDLTEVEGNGDQILDPNETWQFFALALNSACEEGASNVTADVAVNPQSAGPLVLSGSALSFGDIRPGEFAAASTPTRFRLDETTPCGGQIILDLLDLASDNSPIGTDTAAIVVNDIGIEPQSTLFAADFSDLTGWEIVDGGIGTGDAQTWTDTNPGNRSLSLTPPFMIADSDELGFGGEMDDSLISPAIDVSGFGEVVLQFTHDFNWYDGGLDEQADVDVRVGPVEPWVNVANFSGASSVGTEMIDISAIALDATDLQVRFRYSNASYEWWWAVDDVFVVAGNGFVCSDFVREPKLALQNPTCPGPALVEVTDLTPGGPVSIGFSETLDGAVVPQGPCAGTRLDIGTPRLVNSAVADVVGRLSRSFDAEATACGSFIQVLDLTTCETSDPARLSLESPAVNEPDAAGR